MTSPQDIAPFELCRKNDGTFYTLYQRDTAHACLALNKADGRFAVVHFPFQQGQRLQSQERESVEERIEVARVIQHPNVAGVVDAGWRNETYFYATEYVDGERLHDYLKRHRVLPKSLTLSIIHQLCDVIGALSHHPRILNALNLSDFAVTLTGGRHLSLRLAQLGLDRKEEPKTDTSLTLLWLGRITVLLHLLSSGKELPGLDSIDRMAEDGSGLSGPMASLLSRAAKQPAGVGLRFLRELREALVGVVGSTPYRIRQSAALTSESWVPRSPMRTFFTDNPGFQDTFGDNYTFHEQKGPEFSPYRLDGEVSGEGMTRPTGTPASVHVLPPSAWLEPSDFHALQRKMSHRFLKNHPNLARAWSLEMDAQYTLRYEDLLNGFSLATLLAARERLTPKETLILVSRIHPILEHLSSGGLIFAPLPPENLLIQFQTRKGGSEDLDPAALLYTPVDEWPSYEVQFRVGRMAESLFVPRVTAWEAIRFSVDSQLKDTPAAVPATPEDEMANPAGEDRSDEARTAWLPALTIWMLECCFFDERLRKGNLHPLPLCHDPALLEILKKTLGAYDDQDVEARDQWVELFGKRLERLEYRPLLPFRPPSQEKSQVTGAPETASTPSLASPPQAADAPLAPAATGEGPASGNEIPHEAVPPHSAPPMFEEPIARETGPAMPPPLEPVSDKNGSDSDHPTVLTPFPEDELSLPHSGAPIRKPLFANLPPSGVVQERGPVREPAVNGSAPPESETPPHSSPGDPPLRPPAKPSTKPPATPAENIRRRFLLFENLW